MCDVRLSEREREEGRGGEVLRLIFDLSSSRVCKYNKIKLNERERER